MTISSHPYRSETDLRTIQDATAEWIAIAGFQGYLNVSDIALRLFNGMRKYSPGEIVRIWEDTGGQVVGWAMIYPVWNSYEVLLHPEYRQHRLAQDILGWAEHEIIKYIGNSEQPDKPIQLDVFDGDAARITLLEQRGYSRHEHRETISSRPLDQPVPKPRLPDGFSIRSMQGEQEADKLVTLINDSFGWHWTVEDYRKVMHSPGYRAENEMAVIAPDGRFASSCILLPDTHNSMGMVENVGTSRDFRRLGLATALLNSAMQRMQTQGFSVAMVPHSAALEATALYTSVGFRPIHKIFNYSKAVTSEGAAAQS
jgi:mycothiol synthase